METVEDLLVFFCLVIKLLEVCCSVICILGQHELDVAAKCQVLREEQQHFRKHVGAEGVHDRLHLVLFHFTHQRAKAVRQTDRQTDRQGNTLNVWITTKQKVQLSISSSNNCHCGSLSVIMTHKEA